jgi:hypothetical protein
MEAFTSIKNKRAQTWSFDLVIASVIFISGIVILYVYAVNYSSQSKNKLDELFYEGNLAADLILSEGEFGILNENQVNQSKLDEVYLNYSGLKNFVGSRNHFYFTIQNLTIQGNPESHVGLAGPGEVENLVQVTRIVLYKNKPSKFNLYLYD